MNETARVQQELRVAGANSLFTSRRRLDALVGLLRICSPLLWRDFMRARRFRDVSGSHPRPRKSPVPHDVSILDVLALAVARDREVKHRRCQDRP